MHSYVLFSFYSSLSVDPRIKLVTRPGIGDEVGGGTVILRVAHNDSRHTPGAKVRSGLKTMVHESKDKCIQTLIFHIFQKGQVTLNKNANNLQHHFGTQFFMLFHIV